MNPLFPHIVVVNLMVLINILARSVSLTPITLLIRLFKLIIEGYGDGFPDCNDPSMVPITIQRPSQSNGKQQETETTTSSTREETKKRNNEPHGRTRTRNRKRPGSHDGSNAGGSRESQQHRTPLPLSSS